MANELKNSGSCKFSKNGAIFDIVSGSQHDVTGENAIKATKQLTTTDVTLDKGYIGTIGRVFILNLDTTNAVLVGVNGTDYPIKVKPSSHAQWDANAADVHAKSAAGTPDIEYLLIEE
jgi:hypothetical protein